MKYMTDSQFEKLENEIIELRKQMALLLGVIVVQQKDAAEIAGVTDDTVRNKFKRGEIDVYSRDGSRLNFVTLASTQNLKRRSNRK